MSESADNQSIILFNQDLQLVSIVGDVNFLTSRNLIQQNADRKSYTFSSDLKNHINVLIQSPYNQYYKFDTNNCLFRTKLRRDVTDQLFLLDIQEYVDLEIFRKKILSVFQEKPFWEAASDSLLIINRQLCSCNIFIYKYIESTEKFVFFKESNETKSSDSIQSLLPFFKCKAGEEPCAPLFEQYQKNRTVFVKNIKIINDTIICLCVAVPKEITDISELPINSILNIYEEIFSNTYIQYKYALHKSQEQLMSYIFELLHLHNIDELLVQSALQKIGEILCLERVVLHAWDKITFNTILFCEWHSFDIQPIRPQFIKYKNRKRLYQMLEQIQIVDQDDIKQYESEFHNIVRSNNIRSLLLIPTKQNGAISGLFSFADSRENYLYKEDFAWAINNLGNMLSGNVILNRQTQQISLSEKKFRELSMQIPGVSFQLIYVPGKPWKFNYVNQRIKEYFGIDFLCNEDQQLFADILNHIYPDDRQRFIDSAQTALTNQTEWYFEGRAFNGEGEIVWIEGHACVTPYQEYSISNGVIFDITNRKKSEQALKISNARLKTLLSNIRVGIVMTDNELKPTFINETFLSLFGFEHNPEEFLQDKTSLLRKTAAKMKDKRQYLLRLSEMEQKRKIINSEIVELHNGLFIQYGYVPVYENEEWLGHLWFFHDVTERIHYEEELIKAKNIAENSEKTKSSFLASMSHELRTPLNGILGCSDAILDVCEDPSINHLASIIEMSGKRLLGSLNAILDMTAIQAGKLNPIFECFNIYELLEDHICLFRHRAEKQNLYLTLVSDNEFYLNSDSKIINKILDNLTNNAIKFTHKGGITIYLDMVERNNQFWAEIKVADTGIGISDEFKKQIFEPFRQISEGYKRDFDGTGLGLSLTLQYLDLIGGTISLESELGKGSVFTVYIPGVMDSISNN